MDKEVYGDQALLTTICPAILKNGELTIKVQSLC